MDKYAWLSAEHSKIPPTLEGCHSRLSLYQDCLIHAVEFFSWGIDLATYISGGFARGLVVFGTAACI